MSRSLTYFISDLHLGAGYISDPRAHERAIVSWLRSIMPTAKALYLLGDILDYWYEYRHVVPRGHVRFLGALAELADDGVEIVWLKGNHDTWIFTYLPTELGIEVVDGATVRVIDGHTFFLEHGDGVGRLKPTYAAMRRMFRSRLCQRLFAAIHPRWTVGFAHRWSAHSRLSVPMPQDTPATLAPDDALMQFARSYLTQHPGVDYFVFGHRHILADVPVGSGTSRLILLGDGFRIFSYGVWDGSAFTLHRMKIHQ
ncbi:MAG: UDP-2,3-diacylglucosamine diphosphatase [Muribaculaceae bacterium]|nr:UDP-2,3-diacylglucosamine diphosphatase [Muribaculaceae bacterium]